MTDDRPTHFDLVIVGAGSANSIISREFSHLSIALIDAGEHFGGTCLNLGCIPTKMFVHVADVASDALRGAPLGISAPVADVDWPAVRDRVFGRIDDLSAASFRNRDEKIPNVTVFRETFRFVDQRTLIGSSGRSISGTRIVIASGSRPRSLDAAPTTIPGVHTSDTIMRIDSLPDSLLIIGGGAVAAEFAHVFSSFGVRVTQVVRGRTLLGSETSESIDADVSAEFTVQAAARWTVITDASVSSVRAASEDSASEDPARFERAGAHPRLQVELDTGDRLDVGAVLVAVGRVPNSDTLGLAEVGFDLHSDGRLVVDPSQRVSVDGMAVDGIFGLGDLTSHWQLKHVANHEARLVQHNLLHPDDLAGGDPGPVPSVIFSSPQVAYFGVTGQNAPADATVVTRSYSGIAWGWSLEDTSSFCKIIVAAGSGKVLGAHIIGPEASILLQPLIMAASLDLSIIGLARSMYWPHPAATEIVENVLLDAEKLWKSAAQPRV